MVCLHVIWRKQFQPVLRRVGWHRPLLSHLSKNCPKFNSIGTCKANAACTYTMLVTGKVDIWYAAACQHVFVTALRDSEGLFHAVVLRVLRMMFWPWERWVCVTSKTDNLVLAQARHARTHTDPRPLFYCKRNGAWLNRPCLVRL